MVVLESVVGGGLLSSGANQYLQPDYLSPLPTTLDAKKSPLALLAQTCSQIGADSPQPSSTVTGKDKKPSRQQQQQSPKEKPPPPNPTPPLAKTPTKPQVFKPYELVDKKPKSPDLKQPTTTPSVSPKSTTPTSSSSDSVSGVAVPPTTTMVYKPIETNPAFRSPAFATPTNHHQHQLMGGGGYHPYLSYARVKTASGVEALVPVCKDPYCAGGCQIMSSMSCPSGCTQCDHQKYLMATTMLPHHYGGTYSPVPPPPPPPPTQLLRPYVCNWIAGDSYCGKRFLSSEELLQHLRSHTSSGSDANSSSSNSPPTPLALMHRYPGAAPLSPLSARYHPYGIKPAATSATVLPYYAGFPYPYPYSLYGQRLGAQ